MVHAPFGAHPLVWARHYESDNAHLKTYFDAHAQGKIAEYLETYIYGPRDEAEYLERVGIRRLMGLMRNI